MADCEAVRLDNEASTPIAPSPTRLPSNNSSMPSALLESPILSRSSNSPVVSRRQPTTIIISAATAP